MRDVAFSALMLAILAAAALGVSRLSSVDALRGFLPADDPRRDGMVFVPAGRFLMGSTEEEIESIHRAYGGSRKLYENEVPQRELELDAYFVDRTEVTQAQYHAFVEATGHPVPFVEREWARLYNWKEGRPPPGLAEHPVVLVSYDDAVAYCRWARKSLPTEAEWEKAARGPRGSRYPWGANWDRSRLNSAARWSVHELDTIELWKAWWDDVYHGTLRGEVVTTMPVGSFPAGASPYGAFDMAGNVFEWTATWYQPYPGSAYENPEFGEKYRVVRGGDWYLDPIYTRASARLRSPPEHKVPTIGFRCVCREEDVERPPAS